MTVRLRPFDPSEFDALWNAVVWADRAAAVGPMDPELLRSRVQTSGVMTERELLLAIEAADGRIRGSLPIISRNAPIATATATETSSALH
jgi:hypothetical protein